MYISIQIICPSLPRVNRDMEQNGGVTWAGGEGSEAGCYAVLINNLNMNTLCHRKFCTLTGLNSKDKFIGEQRTVCMVCLHCCFGPSGWSEEIQEKTFVTQKTRPTWCRLLFAGGVITVWKIRIEQIELYCFVPMNTECLAQSSYWIVVCGILLFWWDK